MSLAPETSKTSETSRTQESGDNIPDVAPGSVVTVRDADWLVTGVESTSDGITIRVTGLQGLVQDQPAAFQSSLDDIQVKNPREAKIVGDGSSRYSKARLLLETTLRKTPFQRNSNALTVSTQMLARPLSYQQAAVRKALDPRHVRPRILLADAVGLGKTLEIGMILAELVRRGRGDRILVVTPKHVLEQMQQELWTRFALPFVRLDSVGIQKVRQQLPATRNPFTFYKRAIISVDTLKSARYRTHLKKMKWDAVVIDESHNLVNRNTQNNELANLLSSTTDALILASATPHNGDPRSFAELIRLLDPTAVNPDGTVDKDRARDLIIRRHRNSDEVASVVGADWAERKEPENILVKPTTEEDAVATELSRTWLHPDSGKSPATGQGAAMFGWTLAKAFLSSAAALQETVTNRLKNLTSRATSPDTQREIRALETLKDLNEHSLAGERSAKYAALVERLKNTVKVGPKSNHRAVVFAERVATLHWLQRELPKSLGLKEHQVLILHGGLDDVRQQEVVDQFRRGKSDVRVLVTGDVASEGVNLHAECHDLIHFDIPWSLIRIEQRNGRIDRFGQRESPRIATLLLDPSDARFGGDLRVLSRLMEREHEAHTALGDVASMMGEFSAVKEEESIRQVLAGKKDEDEVLRSVDDVKADDDFLGWLWDDIQEDGDPMPDGVGSPAAAGGTSGAPSGTHGDDGAGHAASGIEAERAPDATGLYASQVDYLDQALHLAFLKPEEQVGWHEHNHEHIAELTAGENTRGLRRRMDHLPKEYLATLKGDGHSKLLFATTIEKGQQELDAARKNATDKQSSTWPEALYLGPLHPVLEWAADSALVGLSENQVIAVRGNVDFPETLVLGTLLNRRGQVISRTITKVQHVSDGFAPAQAVVDLPGYLRTVGLTSNAQNPGAPDVSGLDRLIQQAVDSAEGALQVNAAGAAQDAEQRLDAWANRAKAWQQEALDLNQTADIRARRDRVEREQELADKLRPGRSMVKPLIVVLPQDTPVATEPAPEPAPKPAPESEPEPAATASVTNRNGETA
ncbi:MAG: helicase-related protein [Galactobacter sp.]